MEINQKAPYIEIEIDDQGNITTQAHNYPTGKICQGELATQPFETSLIQQKLIPQIERKDRQYKASDKAVSPQQQTVNQSQKINQ